MAVAAVATEGQGAGDNNEVKIPNEVTGGRLVAGRAGDTTIKM